MFVLFVPLSKFSIWIIKSVMGTCTPAVQYFHSLLMSSLLGIQIVSCMMSEQDRTSPLKTSVGIRIFTRLEVVEDEAQLATTSQVCQSLGSKEVSLPGSNEQTERCK